MSNLEEPYVLSRMSGRVLWLTLNRPEERNPLSSQMISALKASITQANVDSEVNVIVITGSGNVFSAGHDLKEMSGRKPNDPLTREQRVNEVLTSCANMMMSLVKSPKAIIACVQATATAAGCQLVSMCDLAIASENAKFCTPGVNIGTFCSTPLVGIGRNIHRKHAMELALTGDLFSAADAVRFGLINKAVPMDFLIEETEKLAQKVASKSATGIRAGKEAFYQQLEMPIESAFVHAGASMLEAMISDECEEGICAFFGKREPVWTNVNSIDFKSI
ncbi:MAG: enoyl-CoA hydratase/carnithine racemase [Alteromonadaceae bacterium]|jgi:enoyl-CoA hydratase/carnithine racemase